jgi:murein DD-endopeptidase MepM/ murein hydrolase activator NlpD
MKKNNKISKIIIFLITIISLLSFSTSLQTTTIKINKHIEDNSYPANDLPQRYIELEERLRIMEDVIIKIKNENNEIYSQILGVDFDTTDYYLYRNDSALKIIELNDSIFENISDRSLYAAEMLALQLKKLEKTSKHFKNNKNTKQYYPNISPIRTKDFLKISSYYGWRKHPVSGAIMFHDGIDIIAKYGKPVYSTGKGIVENVTYSRHGYGNKIVIKHQFGFETLYGHLSTIYVKKGQKVDKNQFIGYVGNSGYCTGTHLHYEIKKFNNTRDPLGYFYTYITDGLLARYEKNK